MYSWKNIVTWKGVIFIIAVCLMQILLTYLTMTLFPRLRKSKNPNYYRAAVFETVPYTNSSLSINEVVQRNYMNYEWAASIAASNEVDILVFPESILFSDVDDYKLSRNALIGSIAGDIPNPLDGDYNPCDQQNVFSTYILLRNLSCLAKNHNMFIVVNLVDYKICNSGKNTSDINATTNCSDESECPSDGMYMYNTNVVFNRAGKLITRYHKKHLYSEPAMNPSKCPEDGFFQTDFGNFTTTICFDMLFKEAEQAIENTDAENLAYPYYWFDHMPFFVFADIFQQSYAIFNKINVLAANAHMPGTGTVGSGIFSASNGALLYTHQPDGISKLLISNVPKQPKTYTLKVDELDRKRFIFENGTSVEVGIEDDFIFDDECEFDVVGPPKDLLKDYRCSSNNINGFEFTKLVDTESTIKLCKESFCCELSYKAYSMDEDYFIAVSATNFSLYEKYNFNREFCFLTRCKSEDGKRCSSFVLHSNTVFETVNLKGTFINKYIYSFSVDSNVRLTPLNQWSYDSKDHIQYQNLGTNTSILFLGLYGIDFS